MTSHTVRLEGFHENIGHNLNENYIHSISLIAVRLPRSTRILFKYVRWKLLGRPIKEILKILKEIRGTLLTMWHRGYIYTSITPKKVLDNCLQFVKTTIAKPVKNTQKTL